MGTYNSVSVNGEWGIIKKVSLALDLMKIIDYQVILGVYYLDGSHQTVSRIDFKVTDSNGNFIILHVSHWTFGRLFGIFSLRVMQI